MDDSGELCLDCGLCCDGTLFERVAIDEPSLAALRAHRLPVLDLPDGPRMVLPCQAAEGALCGIYEQRPTRCREYQCELRLAVGAGRVSLRYARTVIDEARRLRDAVVPQLPGQRRWWSVLARLRRAGANVRPGLRRDLEALESLLERRFWS